MAHHAGSVQPPGAGERAVLAASAGKPAAVLALACVLAHVPMVSAHIGMHPVSSLAMVAISVACLPCAVHLWKGPSRRTWAVAGALATAMVLVHVVMVLGMIRSDTLAGVAVRHHAGGHVHATAAGSAAELTAGHGAVLLAVATGLAVIQAILAAVVLLRSRRIAGAEAVP